MAKKTPALTVGDWQGMTDVDVRRTASVVGRRLKANEAGRVSTLFDVALATVEADRRGIIKADRKKSTQGMTQTEWAGLFGVTGSAASSRVTLWRNLGRAALAGVERDSETWRGLVSGDTANRDGVRQAIEKGDLDVITKATTAKVNGQRTGLEKGTGRNAKTKGTATRNKGKSVPDAVPDFSKVGQRHIRDTVEILGARLGAILPRISDPDLVRIHAALTAAADAVEAEQHRRKSAADAA